MKENNFVIYLGMSKWCCYTTRISSNLFTFFSSWQLSKLYKFPISCVRSTKTDVFYIWSNWYKEKLLLVFFPFFFSFSCVSVNLRWIEILKLVSINFGLFQWDKKKHRYDLWTLLFLIKFLKIMQEKELIIRVSSKRNINYSLLFFSSDTGLYPNVISFGTW